MMVEDDGYIVIKWSEFNLWCPFRGYYPKTSEKK